MAKELFAGQKQDKYKIIIDRGAISKKNIALLLKQHKKVLIISDNGIPANIIKKVTSICKTSSKVFSILLTKGEKAKSLENFQKILNFLAQNNFDRSDAIVALGGGVIGDISGFAASSYLRGIQFIQVPTTLLAQVDSSVGGKTAINISAGKNLVGAFYNPKGVIIDTMVLDSLPKREFKAGLAEVLKYAFIQNRYLFSLLKRDYKKIMSMDKKLIEEIIFESIKTKAELSQAITECYDWVIKSLGEFDTSKNSEMIEYFGKYKLTRARAIFKVYEHQAHHKSKAIANQRLAGATPPGYVLFD